VRQSSLVKRQEAEKPRCCKSLRSNAELVVRESPASKGVNTEAQKATSLEAAGRRYQTTGEDTADRSLRASCSELQSV
jgi:hypothetical protein